MTTVHCPEPTAAAILELLVPEQPGFAACLPELASHPAVEAVTWLRQPRRLRLALREASAADYLEHVVVRAGALRGGARPTA